MDYQRPTEPTVSVTREDAPGSCPDCGRDGLKAYPVLSEGGWFDVVKCQHCLASASREANPAGPLDLLSKTI